MRIAIFHSRYQSGDTSGENRVVEDEAKLLREAGHRVHLWTPMPHPSGPTELVQTSARAIWSGSASAELRKLARSWRPDVIHCHNLFPHLSPAIFRVAESVGIPSVMTLHNYRLMCLPATLFRDGKICEDCVGRIAWRGIAHRCYRASTAGSAILATSLSLHTKIASFDKVACFLAISRFLAAKHVEAGLPSDRIRVKPHFAWPAARRKGPGDYYLFLGRLSPEKGVDVLVEAWRRNALGKLLVVGSGAQGAALQSRAPSAVEFTGDVPSDTAAQLVSNARALIVPSVCYEGAGKVVLEAYAAGVPVVASRIGGLPEAIEDGVSGLLVPPRDTARLAEAIQRLADDEECQRLGEGAWQLWKARHSPQQAIDELESVYRDAIERG